MARRVSPEQPKGTGINIEGGKYAQIFKKHAIHELEPGQAFIARPGVDFHCQPLSFAGYIRAAANARGLKASICVLSTGDVIYTYFDDNGLMRPNMHNYPLIRKLRR